MSQSFDWYNSVLQVLDENYRTSVKNKCSSSRIETSEILQSYLHFKIGSHSYYICFCFTLTVLFYAYHVFIKSTIFNNIYRTQ